MEERISKETKLLAAKDIVASYVRGETSKSLSPEDVCSLFEKVYKTIDGTFPEPEKRKVGLS